MKEKLNNVILGSILIGLGITISDIIINNIQNTSSTSSSPSNSNNNEENEENKKKQKNSISPPTEIKVNTSFLLLFLLSLFFLLLGRIIFKS